MRNAFTLVIVIILLSACAPAASQTGQSLLVKDAWVRPAMLGGNTAVYFTIDNASGKPDRLLDAQCDTAKMVQVHMTTTAADGSSKMSYQEAVELPPGKTITFEPGGLHVMLMDLNKELTPGQSLPVTLQFEQAGVMQIEAVVREP